MNTEAIARPMPALPENMKSLAVDPKRGFVVPWFVQWIDGAPEFRVMDHKKLVSAVKQKLCWVCGNKLRPDMANPFVIGPMCAINRVSAEPPSHPECARYSAMACPFLTMPKMHRRTDRLPENITVAGNPISRNPGVALLWFTRSYEVVGDGRGGLLFELGRAAGCEWYAEGREATRAEVMEFINSGLPLLLKAAEKQGAEAVEQLEFQTEVAMRYLPR